MTEKKVSYKCEVRRPLGGDLECPLSRETMVVFSCALLDYEWFLKYASSAEIALVESVRHLVVTHEVQEKKDWTSVKKACLMMMYSDIAFVANKIASAWRSPYVALGCFRDAGDKHAEVCANSQKRFAKERLEAIISESFKEENIEKNRDF